MMRLSLFFLAIVSHKRDKEVSKDGTEECEPEQGAGEGAEEARSECTFLGGREGFGKKSDRQAPDYR